MATWEQTHGKVRGSYLRVGPNELYVRQGVAGDAEPGTSWAWYVDGILMGGARDERQARAAAELAVRGMSRTHTGRMAAAAR